MTTTLLVHLLLASVPKPPNTWSALTLDTVRGPRPGLCQLVFDGLIHKVARVSAIYGV